MKRVALIIGCQGDAKPLPGVPHDINNVVKFLTSPEGGSWRRDGDEIVTLTPSSITEIRMVIKNLQEIKPDYGFIYFTGHGGTDKRNDRMVLEVKHGQDIYADEIRFADKELVIFDSCRTYFSPMEENLVESRFFTFSEKSASIDTSLAFNAHIDRCEKGRIEIYSSDIDEASYDSSTGGVFTSNYFEIAKSHAQSTVFPKIFDCYQVFQNTSSVVSAKKGDQNPKIEGSLRRRSYFPISIGTIWK